MRVGDSARINGVGGTIESVNLRTIVLRDGEGAVHVFPNGTVTALANLSKQFSFAIVDVRAFRELAFAMVVGILLETFVVRPFLVPALLSVFGELSGWPGGRLARGAGVAADGG